MSEAWLVTRGLIIGVVLVYPLVWLLDVSPSADALIGFVCGCVGFLVSGWWDDGVEVLHDWTDDRAESAAAVASLLRELHRDRSEFDLRHPDLDPVARANIDAIRAEQDRAFEAYTPDAFRRQPT